ncbi:putative lipoate-protein ligase A [Posidoniimonas polymericola]|uniref:Putative lipoate-protein ligase A n=1 Tax=Posidoniimonas polymericola TaxID=2528002 RepID=A0A5C5ZEJ6_9BACT|nr:biotin/lipoate A/B protein ligase family protein [Posidoniimonas polymericola]TWT85560.1 putative lipoate-protein ligase A [Posidoniimonas polymericola]
MPVSCQTPPQSGPPLRLRWLEHTFADPAHNLALDHALLEGAQLDAAADGPHHPEVLRVWEPPTPMVVLGRSSRVKDEVNQEACQADRVPVLRRVSGGATILTGRGCLMYTTLLDLTKRPELAAVDRAHQFVLGVLTTSLAEIAPGVRCAGQSDLVVPDGERLLKFSGNSLRVARKWLLYHGTLMHGLPIEDIAKYLKHPPRQPDYRDQREHGEFLTNLDADSDTLIEALRRGFTAIEDLGRYPAALVEQLADEYYRRDDWNLQR